MSVLKNKNTLLTGGTVNNVSLRERSGVGATQFHIHYNTLLLFCKRKALGRISKNLEEVLR